MFVRKIWLTPRGKAQNEGTLHKITRESSKTILFPRGGGVGNAISGTNDFVDIWAFLNEAFAKKKTFLLGIQWGTLVYS